MATNDEGDSPASTAARGTPAAENNAPTGLPTISGTPQVGETLTASTSNIDDEDGLDNVSYSYQWIRSDNGTDADIAGQTDSTYTLVSADQGKAIKVRVSFTDDADHEETLTSAATAAVAAKPNSPATGAPTIDGTAQVGETLTVLTNGITDEDGLTNVSYRYQWIWNDNGADTDMAGETSTTYTLVTADAGKTIKVRVSFSDDADNQESLTSVATDTVAAKPNSRATGAPTINGTAQVGETLTVLTNGITDEDGLTNVSYRYQWIWNDNGADTDMAGETSTTYTLVTADAGKTIKVRVSFSDDADNQESLTSVATDTVAAKPNSRATGAPTINGTAQVGETLTVLTNGITDADGLTNVSYSYQWIRSDNGTDADIAGQTDSTYTLVSADQGKAIKVRVSFTDDAGNYEALTSDGTEAGATGAAGLPRRSDCRPARDGGLHRHGGHLHRGPQAPVQPARGDGARTGRVGPRVRRTVRGQGPAPPRQRAEHRGPPPGHGQLPQGGG
jgi:NADH:ubiquinone oxidoreductase subunit C